MRLGFFFVATKCLCSSVAHFVEACGASATMQNHAAEPERLKRPIAPLRKRIVSEKQQRRSGQQSTDKQHCPFSCSKRQQSAVVHHVADHCQYPSPKNCEILPENLPKDSMCRTIAKDRARSCRLEATLILKRIA